MGMVDLEDDEEIEKEKKKERRNKKHDWCEKCGRPKECGNPDCFHIHHCTCGEL